MASSAFKSIFRGDLFEDKVAIVTGGGTGIPAGLEEVVALHPEGMKNFKKLLLSIQDKTMNEQKTILEETMAEWKGNTEQVDDILVIGVRF